MPARHDLRCMKCDTYFPSEVINPRDIMHEGDYSIIKNLPCPKGCKGWTLRITWESGEAPKGYLKQWRVEDAWKNLDFNSKAFKDANTEAIKRGKKNKNG